MLLSAGPHGFTRTMFAITPPDMPPRSPAHHSSVAASRPSDEIPAAEHGRLTIALAVTAVVAGAVWLINMLILPGLSLRPPTSLSFLPGAIDASALRPEPLEQQRYIVAALAALGLPWIIALIAGRLPSRSGGSPTVAYALQAGLIGLVLCAWIADGGATEKYLPMSRDIWLVGLVALLVALVVTHPKLTAWMEVGGRTREGFAALAALLATAALCLAGLYDDAGMATALMETGAHMPFTFEETYAVAAGHTPLVDWTPQYSVLLPYVLGPLLALMPYDISSFTLVMVVLSTGVLMLGFGALRLLAGRPLVALGLYIPVLCVGLVPVENLDGQAHTIATYYAAMPMRYAGPLVCLAAVAVFARFGSGRRREWIVLGFLAGATTLNNFEFGLPAAAALVVAASLCDMQFHPEARRRALVRAGCWLGAGSLGAVLGFVALTAARSGELPDFGQLVYFSRQFAAAGFYMLPIDTVFGLPGIIFLTFATSAALGVAPVLMGQRGPDARSRVRSAMLLYPGVFGIGAFAYWVGRSADEVLTATFLPWAFSLAVLAAEGLRLARTPLAIRSAGAPLYGLAVVVFAVVGLAGVQQAAYGVDQVDRAARQRGGPGVVAQASASGLVRACIAPGADVGMMIPYGVRAAHDAGVRDRFPYNHPGSVVTQEQLSHTFDVFADHRVRLALTGTVSREMSAALRQHGFRRLIIRKNATRPDVETADAGPVLALWGTATRPRLRCRA